MEQDSTPLQAPLKFDPNQALGFLAEASALLSSSLDYDVTLKSLARLAVPTIADWCSIEMIQPDGSVQTLAVAHVDPDKVTMAAELGKKYPFDPTAEHGTAQVIRSGHAELIPEIPEEMLKEVTSDPELLNILHDLGLRSSMCVPLKAHGQVLGAINLISAESGRYFDDQSLALAVELGTRAAMAVENASLYREAHRSNAEMAAILAQMADAVMVADASGVVTFANEAATRIFGHIELGASIAGSRPEAQLLTMDGEPIGPDETTLMRAVGGETIRQFHWQVRRAGMDLVLETSAVPLHAPDGSSMGAVTVSRDITAQHDLDRQKDDFLIAASHDLKSPLTIIKGTAQLLELQAAREEAPLPIVRGLQKISATGTRMAEMVDEMLDVTRLQMGRPLALHPSDVDLVSLVQRICGAVQSSSERNPITVDTQEAELVGHWDALRIERVLLNLLDNGCKFSLPEQPVEVVLRRKGVGIDGWAILEVRDRGVGIPKQDLTLVFEQFVRGANVSGTIAGSGIGLAGVKQIVEQHGGSIDVESIENQGSTFTVRLPLDREKVINEFSSSFGRPTHKDRVPTG